MRPALAEAEPPPRNPIRGIFVGCCALAIGKAAIDHSAKSKKIAIFFSHVFFLSRIHLSYLATGRLAPSHLITLSARSSTSVGW